MNPHNRTEDIFRDKLEKGVEEGVFSGAVLLVSQKGEIIFHEGIGRISLDNHSLSVNRQTVFDLASLTKPLATSIAFMRLIDRGEIGLDQPLSEFIRKTRLKDKAEITPRLLLSHSAGFEAWRPFYQEIQGFEPEERKNTLRHKLLELPLVYLPGEKSLYSDLGFMMLEWLLEIASGLSLKGFVREYVFQPLALDDLFFFEADRALPVRKETVAATERCAWRERVIQGEVHDENAYALGGYSGHAGLFGNAEAVFRLVNCLVEHYSGQRGDLFKPETVGSFFTRQDLVHDSTWALGWDTPSQTGSSSGKYFSPKSVGHLGFTGTSVWVDLEKEVMVILLTNRVHPDRNNVRIREFRPEIHDLIMEVLQITS